MTENSNQKLGKTITARKTTHALWFALNLGILISALGLLSACSGAGIPDAKPTTGRVPTVAEVPSADETVRGEDDPPIVTLELGSALHARHLSDNEELPGNIIIPSTNLTATPITAALQAILAGTDISLSWNTGALGDRLVTVMNLSGPLPKVVEKICSAARVFCLYRHGSLELADTDTFIVGLPPVGKGAAGTGGGSSGNSMADTMAQMVGGKVQLDEQGGNVIYTTTVDGQHRVEKYLEELRNGRPLVVLQLYIWDVTLNKENSEGVNWNQLKISGFGPGFAKLGLSSLSNFVGAQSAAALPSGGVSLGAVTTGRLNSSELFSFLSTQGRVQTISSPQVTFVSGSSASFKVGGKQRYISQIGQLVASNNTSGTSNPSTTSGVGSNTVNTDSVDTGLTININGAYEGGVVLANLDLALTNLVSLHPTQSGGQTIDLPETNDQKVMTTIRVRPGDNLVMAGLVTSRDSNTRQGLPLPGDMRLPGYGDDQFQNHELVIIVKPSVILFSDNMAMAQAKKKEVIRPLPDALVIDGNGAKSMAMPGPKDVPSSPLPPQAVAITPNKPELMITDPAAAPTAPIPVSPSTDGAPVDKRLMQRGFSHAFDTLLRNDPKNVADGTGGTP
jgi:hypothetical protein